MIYRLLAKDQRMRIKNMYLIASTDQMKELLELLYLNVSLPN